MYMDLSIGHYKMNLYVLLLIIFLCWMMWGHLLCGCSKIGMMEGFSLLSKMSKEGFTSLKNMPNVSDVSYVNSPPVNTKYWDNPANLKPNDETQYNEFQDPSYLLNKGQLSMLYATKFSPECCANVPAYSNSSGCACLDMNQFDYLRQRGGNNVPYSDY